MNTSNTCNYLRKKQVINTAVAVVIVLLFIAASGCDLFSSRNESMPSDIWNSTYSVGEAGARNSHPAWYTNLNPGEGVDVYVKVFKDVCRSHVPSTGANAGIFDNELGDAAPVTRLVHDGNYKTNVVNINGAQLNAENYTGGLLFLMMVVDTNNGNIHTHSGYNEAPLQRGGSTVPITLEAGYQIGQIGPAGGWVFYNQGDDNNGWRYLEAAPHDFESAWDGSYIANGHSLDTDGNVVNNETIVLHTYEWYWGPQGTFNTLASVGNGLINTVLLSAEAITSATPRSRTGKGRPAHTSDTNLRRDTAKLLTSSTLYGFSDWFIPSLDELNEIHKRIRTVGGFTIENGATRYWSSSEKYLNDEKAWLIDFSKVSDISSSELRDLYSEDYLARVRPVRRF